MHVWKGLVFTECLNTTDALFSERPIKYRLTYFTKHFVIILDVLIWCFAPLWGCLAALWGWPMLVREERGQAATTAASLKLSPSCFSDYQRCKLGNRSSARKGLYQLQSTHNSFPAPPHPACYLNRILVFAVLFSLLCEWVLLFTTHSCRMHSTYECVLGFVCLRDRSFQAFSAI